MLGKIRKAMNAIRGGDRHDTTGSRPAVQDGPTDLPRKRLRVGDAKLPVRVPFTKNEKTPISLLATGGTISAQGSAHSYEAGKVSGKELLQGIRIPRNVDIHTHEFFAERYGQGINSKNMEDDHWLAILDKLSTDAALDDKIVMTHGSDVMALTAFFLALTLPPEIQKTKKIVLTGSMKPANLPDADGPQNLSMALTLAKSKKGSGVLAEMGGKVFAAPWFDKRHTSEVTAFKAVNGNPVGSVDGGKTRIEPPNGAPPRTFDLSGVTALPEVRVISAAPGTDQRGTIKMIRDAVADKAKGIVFAGTGNGTINDKLADELKRAAAKGLLVVRASISGEGEVVRNGHFKDDEFGFACAGKLPTPLHARVLAQVALAEADKDAGGGTIDLAKVRSAFDDYQSPEHRKPLAPSAPAITPDD